MSRFSKHFTQGGQTQLHRLRMWRQVINATIIGSVVSFVVMFGLLILKDHSTFQLYNFLYYKLAKFINLFSLSGTLISIQNTTQMDGDFLWMHHFEKSLLKKAAQSLWGFLVGFILLSLFWILNGRAQGKKHVLDGNYLLKQESFITYIKERSVSSYSIGSIPYPLDMETKHTLILGTTGSGKTNCLHHMMDSFQKSDGGIVVDTTGDLVSRYYRAEHDILLNPFDLRSMSWNMWHDAQAPYHFDAMASALIPLKMRDDFWTSAARILLTVAAQKTTNFEDLLYILLQAPLKEMHDFFKDCEAASLVDLQSQQMVGSIRGVLNANIKSLYYLTNTHAPIFSFRKWSQNPKGQWIFITSMPDQRDALRPLLSTWISTAISCLMSLSPSHKRRIMMIIDELASLNKVDALPTALAELRKYGGCITAGMQDIHQLETLYGMSASKTLIGLFNTRIIFRLLDTETAQRISQSLGEQEISQMVEGISFGSHQTRDGVSLSDNHKIKSLLSRTDLMNLKSLEGIIQFSDRKNIGQYQFTYINQPIRNASFVPKDMHLSLKYSQDDLINREPGVTHELSL